MRGFIKQQARSVIDKMSSEKLIDLMGKGPATRYVLYKGLSDNWVLFYKKLNYHSIEMKYYVGWHGSWEHITIFRGVADDNEKIRKMENNF